MKLSLDLIRKYDRPGPRYTSYPTAPLFSTDVDAEALATYRSEQSGNDKPLSLYVHIPFCHSLCWYCGCNMTVERKAAPFDEYLQLMAREIRHEAQALEGRAVRQIHLGGGTPNTLSPEQLAMLMELLREEFKVASDAEISIELDPRQLSLEKTRAIQNQGFNRVSLGIQDFDPKVQKAINRIQPRDRVALELEMLHAAGFDGVNMDLIYGLPHQTLAGFERTVQDVIDLDPDRIALFNFAYLPKLKAHHNLIRREDLPDAETKLRIFAQTITQLEEAGYVFIGMDHFAKPQDPLAAAFRDQRLHRNFQGYTTMPELEMTGFGMSAISMYDGLYIQNHSNLGTYRASLLEGHSPLWRGYRLNQDDFVRRAVISRLMCRFRIDYDHIAELSNQSFDTYFPDAGPQLDDMVIDGLLEPTGMGYVVTDLGRLLLRNIAMVFDAYLPEMIRRKQASFSRTL